MDREKNNFDNVCKESIKITDDILEQLCDPPDEIDTEYMLDYIDNCDETDEMCERIISLENSHQCSMFYCKEGCFHISEAEI